MLLVSLAHSLVKAFEMNIFTERRKSYANGKTLWIHIEIVYRGQKTISRINFGFCFSLFYYIKYSIPWIPDECNQMFWRILNYTRNVWLLSLTSWGALACFLWDIEYWSETIQTRCKKRVTNKQIEIEISSFVLIIRSRDTTRSKTRNTK